MKMTNWLTALVAAAGLGNVAQGAGESNAASSVAAIQKYGERNEIPRCLAGRFYHGPGCHPNGELKGNVPCFPNVSMGWDVAVLNE